MDIWEKVLTALKGGKNSAILLGVDYEKAFNQMDHAVCLEQLQSLGALPGSLSLVQSFLEERSMTIDIDGCKATPVATDRGSPPPVQDSQSVKLVSELKPDTLSHDSSAGELRIWCKKYEA